MSGMSSFSCRNDLKTFETVCSPVLPKTPASQPVASKSGVSATTHNKPSETPIDSFTEKTLALAEMPGEVDAFVKTNKTGENTGDVLVGSYADHAKFTKEATGNTYEFTKGEIIFGADLKHTIISPKDGLETGKTTLSGKMGSDTEYKVDQESVKANSDGVGGSTKRVVSLDTTFLRSGTAGLKDEETATSDGNVGRRRSIVASIGKQENIGNLSLLATQDTGNTTATTNETTLGYKTTQVSATARQKIANDGNFENDASFEWNSLNEAPQIDPSTQLDIDPKSVTYADYSNDLKKKAEDEAKAKAKEANPLSPSGTILKMRQLKNGNADSSTTVTTAGVAQKFGSTGTTVGVEQVKTDSAGQGSNKSSFTFEQMLFDDPKVKDSGGKLSASYVQETEQKASTSVGYDSKTVSLGYKSSAGNRDATATYNFVQPEGENPTPQLVSKIGARRSLNLDGKDDTSVFMEGSIPVGSSNMSVKTGYSTAAAHGAVDLGLNQTHENGMQSSISGGLDSNGQPYMKAELKGSF